jgi:hypothetical protein
LNTQQAQNSVQRRDLLDFSKAFSHLEKVSQGLAQCPANIEIIEKNGPAHPIIQLVPNRVNVWNLSVDNLQAFTEIEFLTQPNIVTPLIINILGNGQSLDWTAPVFTGLHAPNGMFVLYNFSNTPALTLRTGASFIGSLLAPRTDLALIGNGNVEGQVIAQSLFFQANEVHDRPFMAPVEPCFPIATRTQTQDNNPSIQFGTLTLFPNPTQGGLSVSTTQPNTPSTVRIFNTRGQLVRLIRLSSNDFSVQDLPADQYFAEFLDAEDRSLGVNAFQKVD